jgi:small subunit ribosomal protein S20
MPNCKSAAKRARQNEKNRQRNRAVRSRLKALETKLAQVIESKDEAGAQAAYREVISAYAKAAKTGQAHQNKVDRKKARLLVAVKAVKATA